ncbi:MAG: monovalent cation/H(+) antiporter subunit G [Bacteroidales bacterium]
METLQTIGAFVVLAGSIFIFLGALGLVRMPDVYNRIQAGTKASTLGTLLTLIGLILIVPAWWNKFLLLAIFVIITNPVSSHVLARASHAAKIRLSKKTVTDHYQTYKNKKEEKAHESKS